MKRRSLVFMFLAAACCLSCSRVQWVQTNDGSYIYGRFPKNKAIVWEGDTMGPFASGNGNIVVLNQDGSERKRSSASVNYGAISDFHYLPLKDGLYLGKKKKNKPNGFGALIQNDTIYLGNFKKGKPYSKNIEIFAIGQDSISPCFQGFYQKGKPNGIGSKFRNGELVYHGNFKNGLKDGIGKEYDGKFIAYDGSYKKGTRNGCGKEYSQGILIYDGTWRNGSRNGEGKEYNENGGLVYSGKWENGLYDGKGKLYEKGQCIEGKWEHGRLIKSISTSPIREIANATKKWINGTDSLSATSSSQEYYEDNNISTSQFEFIEQTTQEIEEFLNESFEKPVEKRFGFWNTIRMLIQPWTKNDIQRANAAQSYFCKKVSSKEIQNLINAKVDYYNETATEKLHYVTLEQIPDGAIVNTDTAIKIFEREALETTDTVIGILIDILICNIIVFIISLFIPIPYVKAITGGISLLISLFLCIRKTAPVTIELEQTIKEMLIDNYMQFLDAQNIILQILGIQ